jgi:hypothetical protein
MSCATGKRATGRPWVRSLDQSPNIWWPDDRAWFVATEVDYAWTYVAGPRRLADALLSDDRLEVLPVRLEDQPFYDSDLVNAVLGPWTGKPASTARPVYGALTAGREGRTLRAIGSLVSSGGCDAGRLKQFPVLRRS